MRFILALTIPALVLAGCMGEPADTHFTVPEDAKSFQDTHTGDGYDLRIRVTDANGTPVPGAAVVWFTGGDGLVAFSGSGSIGPGGPRGEGSSSISFRQSGADMLAGGRTNADGTATADLKPGRSVNVAAGDAARFTTEVRFNVAVGGGGDSGTITMVLYPERVAISQSVTMGNHLGRTPYMAGQGESFPLLLAHDAGLDAELRSRIETILVDATWENVAGSGADLYVGLSSDPTNVRWEGDDNQQYVMDGRHTESILVEDAGGARDEFATRGVHVFLLTHWISGGMDGVPVELGGEAVLKGSNVVIS